MTMAYDGQDTCLLHVQTFWVLIIFSDDTRNRCWIALIENNGKAEKQKGQENCSMLNITIIDVVICSGFLSQLLIVWLDMMQIALYREESFVDWLLLRIIMTFINLTSCCVDLKLMSHEVSNFIVVHDEWLMLTGCYAGWTVQHGTWLLRSTTNLREVLWTSSSGCIW